MSDCCCSTLGSGCSKSSDGFVRLGSSNGYAWAVLSPLPRSESIRLSSLLLRTVSQMSSTVKISSTTLSWCTHQVVAASVHRLLQEPIHTTDCSLDCMARSCSSLIIGCHWIHRWDADCDAYNLRCGPVRVRFDATRIDCSIDCARCSLLLEREKAVHSTASIAACFPPIAAIATKNHTRETGKLTPLREAGRAATCFLVTGKPLFKPTAIPVDDIICFRKS